MKDAGLESVNISLDTFRPDRFKAITGINGLSKVIDAVNAAESVGLNVKINTVVIRGWNDDEIADFAKFSRDTGHIVRFIEFMPLDGSGFWRSDLVYTKREIIDLITSNLGGIMPLNHALHCDLDTNGANHKNNSNRCSNQFHKSDPAALFSFRDGRGTIGFIPSMTEPFCANCDENEINFGRQIIDMSF